MSATRHHIHHFRLIGEAEVVVPALVAPHYYHHKG